MTVALCRQVENLKEKLISQAQEVSRLRSELVRLDTTIPRWGLWGADRALCSLTLPDGVRDPISAEPSCPARVGASTLPVGPEYLSPLTRPSEAV